MCQFVVPFLNEFERQCARRTEAESSSQFDQYELAKQHYERALEINPNNPSVHIEFAILLKNHFDQFELAKEHYERALEIAPDHAAAHYNFALLLQVYIIFKTMVVHVLYIF